jgi:hypothetical protein
MPSVSAPALELPALACQTRPHHASGLDRSRALLKSYDCMITTFRHGQPMDYRTILVWYSLNGKEVFPVDYSYLVNS